MTASRPRIGWLAPEDCTLPPGEDPGSITTVMWETALRLGARYELVVAARALAAPPASNHGIRFVRAPVDVDRRHERVVDLVSGVRRKLGLRDRPYAGRSSYFRAYARAQASNLARSDVDLVQLHNTSQWVPTLRAAMPRTPIVLQMHSEWLTEIPAAVAARRLDAVARVVTVSEQVADGIRRRWPERAERVAVVPNGVDAERFRPRPAAEADELRARLGLHDGPVILFVGRLSAEKGLHVLLEALPRIAAAEAEVQVVLVGPAHGLRSPLPTRERTELRGRPEWRARYVEHLRRLADEAPIDVHFAGRIPHATLPLAYALADVYVQPSLFDAGPLPVLEAMAAGLPLVVSSGGALPELVGAAGVVAPVGDASALADAVADVLRDATLAARLGAAARARAVDEFGWDRVATRLSAVYDDVLAEA